MIEVVQEIGSTNAALLERLGGAEDLPEGYWLIADRQTAGRGRAGRVWNDGRGNFMGSTVVRLGPHDPPAQTLSLVAGIAVHRTVSSFLASSGLLLKWPNDLLLGDAKLAGILLERNGDGVVAGMGVNLATAPALPDRRTTNLVDHGVQLSRDQFVQALVEEWAGLLARWHDGGWPQLREEWLGRAHPTGTLISVKSPTDGLIIGSFAGLGEDGVACLRLADGSRYVIHAGDIEMVGSDAAGG